MEPIKRIAAVNDLSGFGRCSLTVAIPILSAMGFQVCPVPTVMLSAHTGYESPYIRDLGDDTAPYLRHWQQLGLTFDGVYTGFLGNAQQADHLEPFLRQAADNGALRLVDPVMADHGRLYATCTPAMVEAMGRLVAVASVATPNLTEACLLTDMEYAAVLALTQRRQAVERIGRQLLKSGCGAVVITGIPDDASRLCNAVVDARETVWVCSERVQKNYAGTGDVFSSVLCGKLLQGVALKEAVEQTAAFVWQVTAHTARLDLPEQDGIVFEPFLHGLTGEESYL